MGRFEMRHALAWLAAGLVLALAALPAAALDPSTLPTQYLIATYQDGLPQGTVRALRQDRDGYLWLGTQEGLVRFDGVRFTVFDRRNAPALGSADIRALLVDHLGRLWIGTRGGGAAVYEDGVFRAVIDDEGRLGGVVYALAEGDDGSLFMGTRGHGVVRYRDGRFTSYGAAEGLPSDSVFALRRDAGGTLWAGGTGGGLAWLAGDRFEAVEPGPLAGDTVLSLGEDRAGRLWIGTRASGVFVLQADRRGPPAPLPGTAGLSIWALTADRDGNLFAGTLGQGLLRLHAGRLARIDAAAGLGNDSVISLLEDREGNLWAGTEGGGVSRLRDGAFRTFGQPEGLRSRQVWTVIEDRQGVLWMGTDGAGLARLEADRITHLTRANGLGSDSITALLEDRRGHLWVGARGAGLQRLDDGRVTTYGPAQGLASDTVLSLAEDREGTLWVGTREAGLFRSRPDGRFEPFRTDPTLADDRVWSLAVGSSGEILAGTDGEGLKIIDAKGVRVVGEEAGLPPFPISTLHTDAGGVVWIGTYGGGLARLGPAGLGVLTSAQGLADDVILQILDDERGALWLASNKGVIRVDKREAESFFRGERPAVRSVLYGKADGMRAAECNGGFQPAGFRGRDGRLWLATIDGVVMVDPAHLPVNGLPPPVVIEEALVDGEALPRAAAEAPRLPPGRERFELRYTGLSLAEPARVRFRYQLEGFDHDWVEAGSERRATYTNLPTGRDYRFRVLAANNDGVWNETGASYAFSLLPHFWETPLFLLFAAAAAALLAWSAYALRVRALVRRTQQLEKLVAARTSEVVAQRDQLEEANTELTRLNQFKSEFLGIAAHDLKNPLSVIYGYAGLMGAKATGDPAVQKVARRISASANQMLTIVSDLLDTTAMESGKLRFEGEATELSALLRGVLESQQVMAADRQIELVLDAPGPVTAVVDREKLTRVMQNLVSNAIRYSPPGTPVRVSLARPSLMHGGIAGMGARGNVIRLSVADQGPGLTAEEIERIFERFERLAAKHQVPAPHSTGLGLAIVKQFVALHGGEIRVESVPDAGSTFIVELPAAPPA